MIPFAKGLRVIADRELEQITTAICWQIELSSSEVRELASLLQQEIVSIVSEPILGLDGTWCVCDGTRYELLIEAGLERVQVSWRDEGPSSWKPLRDLSKMLLRMADAARVTEMLQSSERKQLIKHLCERLHEEQLLQREAERRLLSENNSRKLARRAELTGTICPSCEHRSQDVRFIEWGADAKSYFHLRALGVVLFSEGCLDGFKKM